MSSTHSVSKKVEAIVSDKGEIFYALFEGTFESNVYPKTARVECAGFGKADHVMSRIIRYAASCEGGGLKGVSSNYIKPESYIRQWRKALSMPVQLSQVNITLPFGCGWRGISEEMVPTVRELMRKFGFEGKNSFSLSEPNACELVAEIVAAGVCAWSIFKESMFSKSVESLGYSAPKLKKIAPLNVEIYKLPKTARSQNADCDHLFRLIDLGGQLANTGWPYSTMYQFMIHGVIPAELSQPGCAEFLISTFRDQMQVASVFEEMPTVISTSPDVDPRQMDLLASM